MKNDTLLQSYGQRAVFIVCLLAVALLVVFQVQNYDIFWHLANGRAMMEEGRIVNEELFSYTAAGRGFTNHAWLAQILFYATYKTFGTAGLVGFKVLVVLLIFLLLYKTGRLYGLGAHTTSMLVLVTVLAGITRYTVRPQLFSFLFLSLLGYVLSGARTGKSRPGFLWVIPPTILLWDVLHGAVYGYLFVAAFLAGETLRMVLPKGFGTGRPDGGYLRRLWVVCSVTAIASLLSPYGLTTYEAFYVVRSSPTLGVLVNQEFMPTPTDEFHLFWTILGSLILLSLFFVRRLDVTHLCVFLPFAAAAVRFNRITTAFAIVVFPVVCRYVSMLYGRFASGRPRLALKAVWVLALSACLGYVLFVKFFSQGNLLALGHKVNERRLPAGATRFVSETGLSGNMYNDGAFGGYLAYHLHPGRRIFQYNFDYVFGDIGTETMSRAFLDKYDIDYAVIRDDPWTWLIFKPNVWVPVYWDRAAVVLVRKDSRNRGILKKYALRYYRPGTDDGWLDLYGSSPPVVPVLTREIANCLAFGADPGLADRLGRLVLRPEAGVLPDEGIRMVGAALRHNPESAPLWFSIAEFHLRKGDMQKAEEYLRRARSIDPEVGRTR